jgi:CubicO group peptidase (beta-lactamase class C family)
MIRIAAGCALAFSIALAPVAATAAAAQGVHGPRIERIERTLLPGITLVGSPTRHMSLEERMAHYRVPGLGIAVFDGGRIVWSRSYGTADAAAGARAPVTPTTLFQAASISKPVFAAAALAEVHRGRLSLDRPINDYLRRWRLPDGEAGPASEVTLRRLLSHSAGLSVHGFRGYAAGEGVPTLAQLLDGTAPANSGAIRITLRPGERWRYSGGGTSVAQMAVEDAAGRPLAPLMQSGLLRAAGMRDSLYAQPLPPARARFAARAHDNEGAPVAGGWHIYPEQAAAGLWTTPTDLARFALWVIEGASGRAAGAEQRFVAGRMLEPQQGLSPGPGERMGLGFFLAGEGRTLRFSHGGSNQGFRAFLVGFPETGQGAAILVNGEAGYPLIQELLRAVALEYGWPERFHEMVVPVRADAAALAPLAGTWRFGPAEQAVVVLTPTETGLDAARPGQPVDRFVPIGPDSFVEPNSGIRLRRDGETLVITLPNGPPLTARRDNAARPPVPAQ